MAGETQLSTNRNEFCGGKGLNQSIALKRSGVDVYHAGTVGKHDSIELLTLLEKENISVENIKKVNSLTGHAIIQNNAEGNNSIILYSGANNENTKDHIDLTLKNFGQDDVIILQNEISNIEYILKVASEKDLQIVFNPSPVNNSIKKYPIELVDILVLNEVEGEALTECCNEPKEIIENLHKKYPKAKILLTLGEKGAYFFDGAKIYYEPIIKANVVDTTGAGDTFLGYFISSYYRGVAIDEAMKIATKAASICVTRKGASSSIPFIYEI